jgi:hypothetical protein
MHDLAAPRVWRKSTRSGDNGGNCVEVSDNLPGPVAVRDSKDRHGPVLTIDRARWAAFIESIKSGDFDRP